MSVPTKKPLLKRLGWLYAVGLCGYDKPQTTREPGRMTVLSATKSVMGFFKDVLVDEFRNYPLDIAPWFSAAVYLNAMLFFGVNGWKALVLATVILFAIIYNYGRRTLIRGGIAMLFFSLAVWAGILPDPASWGKIAHSVISELR